LTKNTLIQTNVTRFHIRSKSPQEIGIGLTFLANRTNGRAIGTLLRPSVRL